MFSMKCALLQQYDHPRKHFFFYCIKTKQERITVVNPKAELWISTLDFLFLHFIKVKRWYLNDGVAVLNFLLQISRNDLDINFIDQSQIHT